MLISCLSRHFILSLCLWFNNCLCRLLLTCWFRWLFLWLCFLRWRLIWTCWCTSWFLWSRLLSWFAALWVSFVDLWKVWNCIFLDLNLLCILLSTLIPIEAACTIRFLLSRILLVPGTLILPRQTARTLLVTLLVLFLWIVSLTFWGLCPRVFLLFLFYDIGECPLLALFFSSFQRLRSTHLVDPWYGRLVRYSGWRLLVLHFSLINYLDIVARVQGF